MTWETLGVAVTRAISRPVVAMMARGRTASTAAAAITPVRTARPAWGNSRNRSRQRATRVPRTPAMARILAPYGTRGRRNFGQ